jgi:hypothetical protein
MNPKSSGRAENAHLGLAAVRDELSRTSPTAIDYADIPYRLSQPFLRRADEFRIFRKAA